MKLKSKLKILESCIVPSLTYWAQTWATTNTQINRIRTTYNKMLRNILNISQTDKVKLSVIRDKTKVEDIGYIIKIMKFNYAGHIAKENNKWNKIVQEWTPINKKRRKGKPPTRWRDELVKEFGLLWTRTARDRPKLKQTMKVYAQRWADWSH